MRFSYLSLNWYSGFYVLSQAMSASLAVLKGMVVSWILNILFVPSMTSSSSMLLFWSCEYFLNFTVCKGYLCYGLVLRDHTMNKIKKSLSFTELNVINGTAISFFLR